MKTFIILGMHRSATSLVAKAVATTAYIGKYTNKPSPFNKDGLFEDERIMELNIKILSNAGGNWYTPPTTEMIIKKNQHMKPKIKELITTLHNEAEEKGNEFFGWKEPRTTLTIPLYLEFLEHPHFITVFRDPKEVAKSLNKRDGFSLTKGETLAKIYNKRLINFLSTYSL